MTFGLNVVNVPNLSIFDLSQNWTNFLERSINVSLGKGGDFLVELESALSQNVNGVKILRERFVKSLDDFSVTIFHAGVDFFGEVLVSHFL
jgi:hypothetical protein